MCSRGYLEPVAHSSPAELAGRGHLHWQPDGDGDDAKKKRALLDIWIKYEGRVYSFHALSTILLHALNGLTAYRRTALRHVCGGNGLVRILPPLYGRGRLFSGCIFSSSGIARVRFPCGVSGVSDRAQRPVSRADLSWQADAKIDLLFPVALAIIVILYSAVGQAGGTGYVELGRLRTSHHQADRAVPERAGVGHWLRPVLPFGSAHLAKRLPVRRSWPAVLTARRRASSSAISLSTCSRSIAASRRNADGALSLGNQVA
jgi:hypothetical protein